MKQLLNSERNILHKAKETTLNIDIMRNEQLLPIEFSEATIDAYQVYLDERRNSGKYRLIFAITPMCSNVLFNPCTEIVHGEGSDNPVILGNSAKNISGLCKYAPMSGLNAITRAHAVSDTEYSHPDLGAFTYHCGADIFNNHHIRQEMFSVVNGPSRGGFNTIDASAYGAVGGAAAYVPSGPITSSFIGVPCYYNDSMIMPFKDALVKRKYERDGWFGFYNMTSLPFVNVGDVILNRPIPNNKPCEFYELYPDREMFSFIPKVNKYRNGREEKNWDYCITYPAKSVYTYNGCDFLYDSVDDIKGLKVVGKKFSSVWGDGLCYVRTVVKHGLKVGDNVRIYSTNGGKYTSVDVNVSKLGDEENLETDVWFAFSSRQIMNYWENDGKVTFPNKMRIAKIEGNTICDYYFRLFRKLPNPTCLGKVFQNGEIMSEAEISKANTQGIYRSVVGKMGLSRNIYGDMVGELIFNDDINVKYVRDNRGRKLHEIFLTIVKRAKGGDEWYKGVNGGPGSAEVEFSHCFGKVTSGWDLTMSPAYREKLLPIITDYNVHCIHNIDGVSSIPAAGKAIDDNITIDNEWFMGDICEWSHERQEETVLEDIHYRFNTYQREHPELADFQKITYSDVVGDLFDGTRSVIGGTINNVNIQPEGYFYKPHNRIAIEELSDDIEKFWDTPIKVYYCIKDGEEYIFKTSIPYALVEGDNLRIRYKDSGFTATVTKIENATTMRLKPNEELIHLINYTGEDILEKLLAEYYAPYGELPDGAQYVPNSYGIYYRRGFKPYYSCEDERLKNATFANDATYLERNINIYVKRQDPENLYGLNSRSRLGVLSPTPAMEKKKKQKYFTENEMTLC